MKKKVTIADVAAYCQVSKSSVSRYLNHGYVSQEHKERIQKAIQELGFERDMLASRLKAKHTKVLGVMVKALHKQGHPQILAGIQDACETMGYQSLIALAQAGCEATCLNQLLAQGAEGVILLDCEDPNALNMSVKQHHARVLFANQACDYAPFLDLNEREAGKQMGAYLLEQNVYRIIDLQQDAHVGEKRREGIHAAYQAALLDIHVCKAGRPITEWMDQVIKMDGDIILCEDAHTASHILRYCHTHHIHVPQHLSLACYHDSAQCEAMFPSISALTYPYHAFAHNLVQELIAIIEGKTPQWQNLTYTIKKRESVRQF